MFVQLPYSKALVAINSIRRVIKWGDHSWQLTLDIGSKLHPELREMYINDDDYNYVCGIVVHHNGEADELYKIPT